MVPAAQADGTETPDDICEKVEQVEGAIIGEKALDDLGSDTEDERADDQAQVQRSSARSICNPVEGNGEEEEGYEVQ